MSADDNAVIDPGSATGEHERQLLLSLGDLGRGPDDIMQIAVTHGHWYHYSQAIGWQQYGATVFLGHEEHHAMDAIRNLDGVLPGQAIRLLERAGAPALAADIDALAHPHRVHDL